MTLRLPRLSAALWAAAAVTTFWSFGYTRMWGSDLWWHLATGRWIWRHRALALVDPWSFTRHGQPWLQHEWLADVVFEAWRRCFGSEALVFWKWALIVATYSVLMWTLRRASGDALSAYLAALFALAVGAPFLDVRPHLYSLLGFAILLRVTLPPARPPLWLPLLFLVWANLHGGFFFGLLALVVILGSRALVERSLAGWPLVLASVVACALNPNGLAAFTYPLKYAFDRSSPFRTLGEWRPPFAGGGIQAPLYVFAIAAFVIAVVVVLLPRVRREQPALVLAGLGLGALTLAMSLNSRRFVPLFAMASSLVVALALRQLTAPVLRRLAPSPWRWALPVAALVFGVARLADHPLSTAAFADLTMLEKFPVAACDFVDAKRIAGKVFAYYNWGGYLHLRTDGRLQVFIDGRADTVFDAKTYNDYVRVLRMKPGWMDVVFGSAADYVLWPDDEVPAALVKSGRFRPLADDEVSVLLVRADRAQPSASASRPTAAAALVQAPSR